MFDSRKLGEILMQYGRVKEADIERALTQQQDIKGENKGKRIGELLVEMRACSQDELTEAIGEQLGMEVVNKIDIDDIELELLRDLTLSWTRDNGILPLKQIGDDGVLVAINDPLNVMVLDQLRFVLQREPRPVLVPNEALVDAINVAFDRKLRSMDFASEEELKRSESRNEEDGDIEGLPDLIESQESDDDAPVIKFVNSLFVRAAREKVSDIHIEPGEQSMHVRFRRDGVLQEVSEPPKRFQASIIARVKIMAGLNIAEKRIPQDGRIRIKMAGNDIDIRVATAPTSHGERITMRLLDKSNVLLDLGSIGMNPDDLEKMSKLILSPHGIILVTGPTGSGKTTTLYSALSKINTPDKNILTVEDPVEYQLKGISQMQVNAKIDLTFARGLRSYLRHGGLPRSVARRRRGSALRVDGRRRDAPPRHPPSG